MYDSDIMNHTCNMSYFTPLNIPVQCIFSIYLVICAAAAADWSYPEDTHWGPSCHNQDFGSPIDLDYTSRNFWFSPLFPENQLNFTGYECGTFTSSTL